jgi:hypothetical protein
MVVYRLSLDQQYQPVIERIVQKRKYPRNGQPGVSPQFLTAVASCGNRHGVNPLWHTQQNKARHNILYTRAE